MPRLENRRKNLSQIAHKLGMEFQAEDLFDLPAHLGDFRLFRRGRRKRATNILRKQEGLMEYDIRVFDYRYLKWAGKHVKRKSQTVFLIQSNKLGLPEMWMQPETILHKLGELFGATDIDFLRFPKFSGQYRLTGSDEDYIRHHFTDDVLNYFTLSKGWSMEGVGYYLILYKKDQLLHTKEIKKFYRRGIQIYEMLTNEAEKNRLSGLS